MGLAYGRWKEGPCSKVIRVKSGCSRILRRSSSSSGTGCNPTAGTSLSPSPSSPATRGARDAAGGAPAPPGQEGGRIRRTPPRLFRDGQRLTVELDDYCVVRRPAAPASTQGDWKPPGSCCPQRKWGGRQVKSGRAAGHSLSSSPARRPRSPAGTTGRPRPRAGESAPGRALPRYRTGRRSRQHAGRRDCAAHLEPG